MTEQPTSGRSDAGFDLDRNLDDVDDTRPALSALVNYQREMLNEWLTGFDSREALIEWSQDCCIATLGELPDEWYETMLFHEAILALMLEGPAAQRWAPASAGLPSQEQSTIYRIKDGGNIVDACNRAMEKMRYSANEYVGEDVDSGDVPDAGEQEHVAMRPALSELDERQEATLEKLLDGFKNDREILHWALVASQSTFAEFDGEFASKLENEQHALDLLVGRGDPAVSAEFREDVAATHLIPSFNAAARRVIDGANEADSTDTDHDGDTNGGIS